MKFNKNITKSILILSMITMVYCGDPIPVEEMGLAKHEIAKAESVQADKYANSKYEAAKKELFNAHDFVSKEKMEDAKKSAIEARKLASEAYGIAAPKLASDTKAESAKAIAEADERFAEEFASDEYTNAKKLQEEGDALTREGKYVEAFNKYEEAREEANKARNIAESQAEILNNDIRESEDTLTQAEKYGARKNASTEYISAKVAIKESKSLMASLKLKQAYPKIQKAKTQSQAALDLSQGKWASDKNDQAKMDVATSEQKFNDLKVSLEDEEAKKYFDDSQEAQDAYTATENALDASKESLESANSALSNKAYKDSYNQSEEAIRLAKIVEQQIPQVSVLVASAKKRAIEEKASTGKTVTTDETTDKTTVVGKGWKTYKVRLIPERRDCLWRIAAYKKIYNNARLWPRIYKANKDQIKNPDLIYPGQVFDIPPKRGSTTKKSVENTEENDDLETDDNEDHDDASDDTMNAN